MIFAALPLLALPVLAYNLVVLTQAGGVMAPAVQARIADPLFTVPMSSGVGWTIGVGDLLLGVSLVVLFIELLKSTTSQHVAIINHALSMLLFIICLVEFLLAPAFATSTFFLILVMVLLDVLAGFIVTIMAARRDIDFAGQ